VSEEVDVFVSQFILHGLTTSPNQELCEVNLLTTQ
jgi:hypothetical protein